MDILGITCVCKREEAGPEVEGERQDSWNLLAHVLSDQQEI
jgi:hypothetical protein